MFSIPFRISAVKRDNIRLSAIKGGALKDKGAFKNLGLGLLGAAVSGLVGYLSARLRLSMPRTSGKIRLSCLDSPVEVIYDRAGTPHITASSDEDGFRALGYVMAQDRLVQIQLMLKIARGELSELIGTKGLAMDRFIRTLGIERTAREAVKVLKPESRELLEAFGQGFNAYTSRNSLALPIELLFLGGRPRPWTSLDCITSYLYVIWMLDTWWTSDILRERLIRSLGYERAMQLLPETADYNNPPCKVGGPGVSAETMPPGEEIDWGFDSGPSGGELIDALGQGSGYGSNNWVISGSKTASGKPILACDPHMQHNIPGLLYLFHLRTPGYDVAGAGFPGLPAVAFGHNGYCGWAATNLDADTIDLYVETFESESSNRYLCEGEWVEADIIEEEIRVRFAKPRLLRVLTTRHGPVIRRKGNKGLALRWVSREVHLDTFNAMLRQSRARCWEEFSRPMEDYLGPCSNQVYADVDGNIAYQAIGKVPLRSKGDGTVPYPGEGSDCEWKGVLPFQQMPKSLNPPDGFIATANSKATTDGFPALISREWNPPYRNARISELLRERNGLTPGDMSAIQGDLLTYTGKRFAEIAVAAASSAIDLSPAARSAIERLKDWDHRAIEDSVAMTIYFYSWRKLIELVLRHRLGSTLFEEYICNWTTVDLAVENILEEEDGFWLPPGFASFDSVIIRALEEAVSELERVFGTGDQSAWKWGRVHHLTFKNPLGLFWPLNRIFNIGPVPIGGEASTVNPSSPGCDGVVQVHARSSAGGPLDLPVFPRPDDYSAFSGPVLRMVLDFSNLDNSMVVLDTGQSGHRLSRHYKDHFPLWKKVEYFPFPYTTGAIEANRESTLRIVP